MAGPVIMSEKRPLAFSYSKIKNFRICPKRSYHMDIAKDYKEELSETLAWGNSLHAAFAKYLMSGAALPVSMEQYVPLLDRTAKIPGKMLVEQKFAIRKDFSGCGYFDKDVWFRSVGDVVVLNGSRAAVLDWKTGKVLEDSQQLGITAAHIFGIYPEVQEVDALFIWLKDEEQTKEKFRREDMPKLWNSLHSDLSAMQNAHDKQEYPAKPGFLCRKYCAVTACVHNGT